MFELGELESGVIHVVEVEHLKSEFGAADFNLIGLGLSFCHSLLNYSNDYLYW